MNNHYSEQFIQARSAMRCLYLELPESVARDAEALVVAALVAADERNRELTARLEAAEKLIRKCRDEMGGLPHSLGYAFTHLPEIDAWLATPAQPADRVKPVAGEERAQEDCVHEWDHHNCRHCGAECEGLGPNFTPYEDR